MPHKEDYRRLLAKQLEESRRFIDELTANPDFAHAAQQREIEEEIRRLRDEREAVREQLEQLEQADEHAWEGLIKGVEDAWRRLDEALRSTWSRFNQ